MNRGWSQSHIGLQCKEKWRVGGAAKRGQRTAASSDGGGSLIELRFQGRRDTCQRLTDLRLNRLNERAPVPSSTPSVSVWYCPLLRLGLQSSTHQRNKRLQLQADKRRHWYAPQSSLNRTCRSKQPRSPMLSLLFRHLTAAREVPTRVSLFDTPTSWAVMHKVS